MMCWAGVSAVALCEWSESGFPFWGETLRLLVEAQIGRSDPKVA